MRRSAAAAPPPVPPAPSILRADSKDEAIRIATEFTELHRKYWAEFQGESEVRTMLIRAWLP